MVLSELLSSNQLYSRLQVLQTCKDPVLILFTAERGANGERWCPDCVAADPVLDDEKQKLPASCKFIQVELTRDEWKVSPGADHPLRKEPYSVRGIPTLLHWNCAEQKPERKRFGEADLLQQELVGSFFSDLAQM